MPGSITCPLIPGVPAKRNILQSAGYVTYIYYLVMALKAPLITYEVILPIIVTLAILTPFDFVTFQASRGEHSVYMLFCCLFPWGASGLTGMRLCQACLWTWAGIARIGNHRGLRDMMKLCRCWLSQDAPMPAMKPKKNCR